MFRSAWLIAFAADASRMSMTSAAEMLERATTPTPVYSVSVSISVAAAHMGAVSVESEGRIQPGRTIAPGKRAGRALSGRRCETCKLKRVLKRAALPGRTFATLARALSVTEPCELAKVERVLKKEQHPVTGTLGHPWGERSRRLAPLGRRVGVIN